MVIPFSLIRYCVMRYDVTCLRKGWQIGRFIASPVQTVHACSSYWFSLFKLVIQTYTQKGRDSHIHSHTGTQTQRQTLTHTDTYTYTRRHTHTHPHIHTHTQTVRMISTIDQSVKVSSSCFQQFKLLHSSCLEIFKMYIVSLVQAVPKP